MSISISKVLLSSNELFPVTNEQLAVLGSNLSKNLESKTNGQIRRKPNWLLAQLVESLPNQSEQFNINTLKSIYSSLNNKTFSDACSDINNDWIECSSILEKAGSDFINKHKDIVNIEFDDEDGYWVIYLRKDRDGNVCACPNCGDLDEYDECEDCVIEAIGGEKELLDSLNFALSVISKDSNVDVPGVMDMIGSKEDKVTESYIVVVQNLKKPELIETMNVSVVNPDHDYKRVISQKVNRNLLQKELDSSEYQIVKINKLSELSVI